MVIPKLSIKDQVNRMIIETLTRPDQPNFLSRVTWSHKMEYEKPVFSSNGRFI